MRVYIKNIWLGVYTVLVGMKITLVHLFSHKVTNQYPDKYHPIKEKYDDKIHRKPGEMPPVSRNRLFVDMDECNGCKACERDCPVMCITVETQKVTPGDTDVKPLKSGGKRGLWVTKHEIDFAKCCFCSLCTQNCPTLAIRHTTEFEYSTYNRNSLLYQFSIMTPGQITAKQEMYNNYMEEKKKAEDAKKVAEAAAKAAEVKEPSSES